MLLVSIFAFFYIFRYTYYIFICHSLILMEKKDIPLNDNLTKDLFFQEKEFVEKELFDDLTILPSPKEEYIMEYDKNSDTIKDYGEHSEKIRSFMSSLPAPENSYEANYQNVPLLYRWMNLTLDDFKNIVLHEGLLTSKTEWYDQLFFTSQPQIVLFHWMHPAEDIINETNNKRVAVVFAIEPKILKPYRIGGKWGGTFTVDNNIPHDILLQWDIYVYNHKKNVIEKIKKPI